MLHIFNSKTFYSLVDCASIDASDWTVNSALTKTTNRLQRPTVV